MARTIINGTSKIEIIEKENFCIVTFFELMGERYVQLGASENWDKALAYELF